jgi:tetratricopeptide (TPR) repeat protein
MKSMTLKVFVLLMLMVAICPYTEARTFQERLQKAESQLAGPRTDLNRFYNLCDAAKTSFELGAFENARKYSMELLALAPQFKTDWNYGNAIHDGNMVLGRLALLESKIDDAKSYLLAAGKTPGSPQLDSFGPNLSLAKDLLEQGHREVVIQYLDLCAKFWEKQFNDIDKWKSEIRAGKVPGFGANLVY